MLDEIEVPKQQQCILAMCLCIVCWYNFLMIVIKASGSLLYSSCLWETQKTTNGKSQPNLIAKITHIWPTLCPWWPCVGPINAAVRGICGSEVHLTEVGLKFYFSNLFGSHKHLQCCIIFFGIYKAYTFYVYILRLYFIFV